MNVDAEKRAAAQAAMAYVPEDSIIGVGTGSTVNYFIDALAKVKHKIEGTVSSSEASTQRLKAHGIPVYDFNGISKLPIYVDGADQINSVKQLIKGGGGALTREKILAYAAEKFICIADQQKTQGIFGAFALPIEVIPLARSCVARKLVTLGGNPVYRENFLTDNGNVILDLHNLTITHPIELEKTLNNIPGVVCNGLFAMRNADIILLGNEKGVKEI